jgi:alpha-galactosidase
LAFCSDWRGKNADRERETEVRLLWSPDFLFIQFRARYREIYVFPDANSRRDQLWLRDVAEVFIQPGSEEPQTYKEFEISPNGDWLDLDIAPGRKSDLLCNLKSRVIRNPEAHIWVAELAIPMACLTPRSDPDMVWRLNFFRVEGPEPNRFYSAWRPTNTAQPNFHVPAVFGELHLAPK